MRSRKNRSPEEQERRAKIRELLQDFCPPVGAGVVPLICFNCMTEYQAAVRW